MSEVPSGFEDQSRSSSCASCSHLGKDQKSSDEGFGSLNLTPPSLLLRVMVVLVLEVDCRFPLSSVAHSRWDKVSAGPGSIFGVSMCRFQDCCPAKRALELVCHAFCLPEQGGLHGRVMLDSVCNLEFRHTVISLPLQAVGIKFSTAPLNCSDLLCLPAKRNGEEAMHNSLVARIPARTCAPRVSRGKLTGHGPAGCWLCSTLCCAWAVP